ncbi:MAG: LysR substrate-binding domain-containing protein [Kiloniellaceae bacterium]
MSEQIEARHLRYFIRVAEELHFGRAAERLGIAQPPLSHQIRQLESRVGVRLLDRTTRSVKLTPAGEAFLTHARHALAAMKTAVNEARQATGMESGHLAIGAVQTAIQRFLPAVIRDFRKHYPLVTFDISPGTTEDQVAKLIDGSLQVAFIRPPLNLGAIALERIFSEGFVAVLPAGHPLAQRADLALGDLAEEPFVLFSPIVGIGYQTVLLDHCRRAGFRPRVIMEATHTVAIATLVAAGIGIAVIPAWIENSSIPGVIFRPLPELPEVVDLCVAWLASDPSPLVQHFVQVTRQYAESHCGPPQSPA